MNFVQSHPEGHVYFFYIQQAPESFAKALEKIYKKNKIQTKLCMSQEETNKNPLNDVAVFFLSACYMSYIEYVHTHINMCQSLSLNPVDPTSTRSWLLLCPKRNLRVSPF